MKNYTDFDIMITIIEEEWKKQMNKDLSESKWESPAYSKSQINKAGKIIADLNTTTEEKTAALDILNNWRSSHAYPLQVIASNLRRNNKNAIVVQRLKRLESITGKLTRFPEMSLYRMQDLGGCRVIVDSIDEVYHTLNKYKNSRIRHILKREDDYIQHPKKSGYRSYHIVYQFQSDEKETYNKNMLIEIQFRTKLQHIWATAVEMMGIYTKSNLKSSMGDKNILKFFVLVSSVFAKMEGMPVCPNTVDDYDILVDEIKKLDSNIHVLQTLSNLSMAIKQGEFKKGKIFYYVLLQNYREASLEVFSFSAHEIERATYVYNKLEALNDPDTNIVLVSANSFDALKAAYPNYFADISKFVDMMQRILA